MVVVYPPHFRLVNLLEPKDSGGKVMMFPNRGERTIRFRFMGGTIKQQADAPALQFLV